LGQCEVARDGFGDGIAFCWKFRELSVRLIFCFVAFLCVCVCVFFGLV
jgi:hypothetical protein